ncbi:MAG: flavodoxin [Bombilactobacillus mellifer]|nr:flavodoxin [Bombilactobacillus mellifer]
MTSALVVYASITGNNEEVAEIVNEELKKLKVNSTLKEISITNADEFENVDICVVCPYTYGEGDLPEEGMDFYEDLPTLNLKGKVFGCAGSGDTYYEEFATAVDDFANAFIKAGAQKGAENLKIDLAVDENDLKNIINFTKELVATFEKVK